MFTGIVEELGKVVYLNKTANAARLGVEADIFKNSKVGDSVCINGACLTIAKLDNKKAEFDVSQETLDKTYLGKLKIGEKVNIERALKVGDRFGGHFVTGHVDCVSKILGKKEKDDNMIFEFEIQPEFKRYIINKGSVSIDGISLTIAQAREGSFLAYVIPHTAKVTTLGLKSTNDLVNVEFDMFGKYAESMLDKRQNNKTKISETFLKEHGFMV
jgi:riboflavin synthase